MLEIRNFTSQVVRERLIKSEVVKVRDEDSKVVTENSFDSQVNFFILNTSELNLEEV